MSSPSPERGDMEDDHLDLPPDDESTEPALSGGDSPEKLPEQEHLAEILDEELQKDAAESGPEPNRFRQLLHEREDASEEGSIEGLPRRAGSPIGSLLSVPDDTPSIQVRHSNENAEGLTKTTDWGLRSELLASN
jgi:vacuolar protein sorting-associated protein 8